MKSSLWNISKNAKVINFYKTDLIPHYMRENAYLVIHDELWVLIEDWILSFSERLEFLQHSLWMDVIWSDLP